MERLQRALAVSEEQRELLEFQVIEIRECGRQDVGFTFQTEICVD